MKKRLGNENSWQISKTTKRLDGDDSDEHNDNDDLFMRCGNQDRGDNLLLLRTGS